MISRTHSTTPRNWDALTYLEGEAGPSGWAKVVEESGLSEFARMLRDYHQAVAEWHPREEITWYDGSTGAGGEGEIVCHGDYGPWNVVWRGTTPTGLIDWEYARVAPPAHDVYYALQYVAPFRSDEECVQWLRYSAPPDRKRRTEIFLTSYGWTGPADVVDGVVAVQRETHAKVEQLAARGHVRQRIALAEGAADRVACEIAWAEQNRGLFSPG